MSLELLVKSLFEDSFLSSSRIELRNDGIAEANQRCLRLVGVLKLGCLTQCSSLTFHPVCCRYSDIAPARHVR